MLASITPLGERGRGRRWRVSAPAFVVGAVVGGAAAFSAAGALGRLLGLDGASGSALLLALACLALAAAVADATRVPRRLGPRRQVSEDWLTSYREWVYGGGYGVQLGLGVVTQVTTAAVWVALAGAAALASPVAGAVAGAAFGAGRALPLLAAARVHDAAALRDLHRASAALDRPTRWATAAVLALVAAGAATAGALS